MMQLFSMIVRFFQGGGAMMYPIAMVLVIGAAIAFERYIVLTQTSVRNRGLWNEIAPLLAQGHRLPHHPDIPRCGELPGNPLDARVLPDHIMTW